MSVLEEILAKVEELPTRVPPQEVEEEDTDMELHTMLLMEIFKSVTKIEAELGMLGALSNPPAMTFNTNPVTDAILMDNPAQ